MGGSRFSGTGFVRFSAGNIKTCALYKQRRMGYAESVSREEVDAA